MFELAGAISLLGSVGGATVLAILIPAVTGAVLGLPIYLLVMLGIGIFFVALAIILAILDAVLGRKASSKTELQRVSTELQQAQQERDGPRRENEEPEPRRVEQLEYENERLRGELERTTSEADLPPNVAVERLIANRDFRLLDLLRLAGTGSTVEGKDFENCTIRGPGVITTAAPQRPPDNRSGSRAIAEVWHWPSVYVEGTPEAVLYEVPSGGATASGVIHLVGCSYKRVTFIGIGIAGSPDELRQWRDNATFGGGPPNG